jgi:hypothetical protein
MIVTQDIFKGELAIVFNKACAVDIVLTGIIEKYEPIILIDILGIEFYNQIQSALLVNPLATKWNALINGGSYQSNGATYPFRGLKYILAGFIYYHYHRNNAYSPSSEGGQVITSPENAQYKSMAYKMWGNWNDATNMIGAGCEPKWGTLNHFLINSDFNGYEVNEYKGGKIKGVQWLA